MSKFWDYIRGRKSQTLFPDVRPAVIGNEVVWYDHYGDTYINKGYADNDIVFSCVELVMDKVRCAPWGLFKVEDESSLKLYQGITRKKTFSGDDWKEAMTLRKKALVPMETFTPALSKLKNLLTWPNETETFTDLVANSAAYEMLLGNAMWDGMLLGLGANAGIPQEIINLPPQYITILATKGYPSRVIGYQLSNGEIIPIAKERVLHIKHWNPAYDFAGTQHYGLSPLKAASKVLKRSNSAKYASVMAFENGGAAGVLYVDDERMTAPQAAEQIAAIKAKWNDEYSGKEHFKKVALSGYKTGFTKITDTLVDMNLIAMEDLDLRRLANIWGIPSQLLNDPANKTYNNQKEAEVALTSRCALPKLTSRRDNLNRKLQTDWGFKGVNVYVDFDMSVFSELQEDSKAKWEWVSKLPVSTGYKLEMMGLDVPDSPAMDEILIPTGYQRLEDVAMGLDAELEAVDEELRNRLINEQEDD